MADAESAIAALRNATGGLDSEALRKILPYGNDFLFVDRVERLTDDEVAASFRIPKSAPYLDSHFADMAIMPGVLLGEGLAQAASLIVRLRLPSLNRHHILGLEIERVRFFAPARPGDELSYSAQLKTMNRRTARLSGTVSVDKKKVCSARLVVAIVDRERLRRDLAET